MCDFYFSFPLSLSLLFASIERLLWNKSNRFNRRIFAYSFAYGLNIWTYCIRKFLRISLICLFIDFSIFFFKDILQCEIIPSVFFCIHDIRPRLELKLKEKKNNRKYLWHDSENQANFTGKKIKTNPHCFQEDRHDSFSFSFLFIPSINKSPTLWISE